MNQHNAAEYLPLVIALSEGKTIQCRPSDTLEWQDSTDLVMICGPECYRIKPEPREFEGVTQATSYWQNDGSGHIRLAVNWVSGTPKIGTKFRLIEIL